MSLLPKHPSGSPYLFLAPMEGVGDRPFRKAMAQIGGFDEAVTEFIRVPKLAHVESLARVYDPLELSPIPLAAQIMGAEPDLIAEMGVALAKRGALRIDLNCGCPSNTVTGKGAGSSLLKNPNDLYIIAKALVKAVSIPVTLKMRSGYDDTALFKDNLQAAESSGVSFITLHPRTKKEGYTARANWDLIKEAKQYLSIPVVGNGDITKVQDALNILEHTGCDALMIGRGSVMDPFLFKKIKAHYENISYEPRFEEMALFLSRFLLFLGEEASARTKINKLKQILGFLFKATPQLLELKKQMLSYNTSCPETFLAYAFSLLKQGHLT